MRMDGLRSRVGGALIVVVVVVDELDEADEDPASDDGSRSLGRVFDFVFSFLELGLGGGLCSNFAALFTGVPPLSFSSSLSPKSKILVKFNPTFGELLKRFTSSAGLGVANVSPVAVSTTPFIADGIKSLFAERPIGVARDGKE